MLSMLSERRQQGQSLFHDSVCTIYKLLPLKYIRCSGSRSWKKWDRLKYHLARLSRSKLGPEAAALDSSFFQSEIRRKSKLRGKSGERYHGRIGDDKTIGNLGRHLPMMKKDVKYVVAIELFALKSWNRDSDYTTMHSTSSDRFIFDFLHFAGHIVPCKHAPPFDTTTIFIALYLGWSIRVIEICI